MLERVDLRVGSWRVERRAPEVHRCKAERPPHPLRLEPPGTPTVDSGERVEIEDVHEEFGAEDREDRGEVLAENLIVRYLAVLTGLTTESAQIDTQMARLVLTQGTPPIA